MLLCSISCPVVSGCLAACLHLPPLSPYFLASLEVN